MNVLILQQREWATKFGIPLAKYLKKKYPEAKFAAWVYKISTWNAIKSDNFKYEKLWLGYKSDDKINDKSYKERYSGIDISDIERNLGIESVWRDLIHIDRNLIYHPGKKWRYAFIKQVSDEIMLDLVRLNYLIVRDEIFGEFNPDIIILPNFGSLFHVVLYYFAKQRGINCWMPTATKISGRMILTNENNYELSEVKSQYFSGIANKESFDFAKDYVSKFQEEYISPENFINRKLPSDDLHINIFKDLIKIPVRMIKKWNRNRDPLNPKVYKTLDNISAVYELKRYFHQYKNLIQARSFKYTNFKDITDDFIYFPLHVQPEVSTNLWAPYFSNQLEVIRQLAISLPGKYTLVVKEHPIMIGWRSSSYYKKIIGLPNVKLISYNFTSYEVFSNSLCKGVVVISGTTGFEAIISNKPTIVLSKMFYEVLPHCFRVKDFSQIPEIIEKMTTMDFALKKNKDKLLLLIAILYERSEPLEYGSIWGLHKQAGIEKYLELIDSKVKLLKNK